MLDSIEYISMSRQIVDDGYGFSTLKMHISTVEAHPEECLAALRAWRATHSDVARHWPLLLGGLLYTPYAVPPLSDALIDAITLLDDDAPVALRRLPRGLASVMDAEVVVKRLQSGIAALCDEPDASERVEQLARLAERALEAFDQSVHPETQVGHQQHWMRKLASSMRSPLARIVDLVVSAVPAAHVDRAALFTRLWAWLRKGWLDELRHVNSDPDSRERHTDRSEGIASILDTPDAVQEAVRMLGAETKSVQTSPTFRPLLFALLTRLGDPDEMRGALPASPTWRHHEAMALTYEERARSSDAIAYLTALKESPERDALLHRLMRENASDDEAFALERPHPSNLAALMSRYGKPQSELLDVGIQRMRRGEEDAWLEFLVRAEEWKRALLLSKRADPETVLRLLDTTGVRPLPQSFAHDLARTCLEHAFDSRKVWRDGARAKDVVGTLLSRALALAPDAKSRAKALAKARAAATKVIAKSEDYFTRELAFALEEALARHEPS